MGERGRYIVTAPGPWCLYAKRPPPGFRMLGTIQAGDVIGALAESPDGTLYRINGERRHELHQRKARAALAAAQSNP